MPLLAAGLPLIGSGSLSPEGFGGMAGEAGCYVNASVSASVCHMTSSSLCLTPRVCCIHLHAGVLSQRAAPP